MKLSVRVRCWAGCDDRGMMKDEEGIWRVCGTCMGQTYRDVNPDEVGRERETHEWLSRSEAVP